MTNSPVWRTKNCFEPNEPKGLDESLGLLVFLF